jgi:hypothetical protein
MARRVWKALFLVAVVGLGWSLVQGDSKGPAKPQSVPEIAPMRAKVSSSHKIMEGLVARDFTEIRSGALELKRICEATEWEANSDHVYAQYRAELIRQANKLIDAADQSHADAATFAYMNTLSTCINCHDHCRDVLKIATVKRTAKVVPIPTTDSDDAPDSEKVIRR